VARPAADLEAAKRGAGECPRVRARRHGDRSRHGLDGAFLIRALGERVRAGLQSAPCHSHRDRGARARAQGIPLLGAEDVWSISTSQSTTPTKSIRGLLSSRAAAVRCCARRSWRPPLASSSSSSITPSSGPPPRGASPSSSQARPARAERSRLRDGWWPLHPRSAPGSDRGSRRAAPEPPGSGRERPLRGADLGPDHGGPEGVRIRTRERAGPSAGPSGVGTAGWRVCMVVYRRFRAPRATPLLLSN
jgi:hypothetical protein